MSAMCGLDRLLIPYRERHPVAAKWPRVGAGDGRHLAPTLGWNILSFQDIKKQIASYTESQGVGQNDGWMCFAP